MIRITAKEAAEKLLKQDNIFVLMHRSPDGDTIGCGYALCMALQQIGKKARLLCADEIPQSYEYFTNGVEMQEFDAEYIVTVDVADRRLLGDLEMLYGDKVDLCIDHHGSNREFAEYGVIAADAPACAQIMPEVIEGMGAKITMQIADALFTGLTTDTGCFRYTGVTAQTHRTASYLIEKGARSGMINRLMFETKPKRQVILQKLAMESLQYFCGEQVALICITTEMMQKSGALDHDTESIPSIPRQIEGVKVAVTVKQKADDYFRISLRTTDEIDASEICRALGGGGHRAAAGCSYHGTLKDAVDTIVRLSSEAVENAV